MSDLEQQPLIDFLEQERIKRELEVSAFATLLGLSPSQYYNLRQGKKAGPQQCIDLARAVKADPNYFLYLGGHITADELDAPREIPPELMPAIQKLARMRGTPFFDTAMKLVEDVIDKVVHLWDVAA